MAAPGSATTTTSAAIIKTKYTQPKVYWLAYKNNPAYAKVRKDETFDGDSKVIAVQTETPQGGGVDIATAQANANPSVYKKFIITRVSDFGVARITGEAMKAAEKNSGALLNLWQREMDGILQLIKRSAAIHMFRNGNGARGNIGSISTTTITLALVSDITNFAVGMTVQLAAAGGGALRNTGATGVITAINRVTGTISFASNVTTIWAAAAVGDDIVRNGDAANAGTNKMITGRAAWTPAADPTGSPTLFSLDRSSDYTRLSGLRLNGLNAPMQESLIEAESMIRVEGSDNELDAWMHPRDRAQFVKELGAKVTYFRQEVGVKDSTAKIGFSAIRVESDSGVVNVMSDLNCPRGTCYVEDGDTLSFESLGAAPQILDWDSNEFLRVTNDDSYEVRVGYYGQFANAAPAFTCNISNFGL